MFFTVESVEKIEALGRTGVVAEPSFIEKVTVEVAAALIAAAILAFVGLLARKHLWRPLRNYWRASVIRKAAGAAFTIIHCPIANDDMGTIGYEISIRLETAFRAFAGWETDEARPFQVVKFPLELPNDESTTNYDKAVETAKRWLEKINGDVLIWGKRVKGDSVGFIRLIGKNRKKGVIEARRVDFDKKAVNFDEALATAIAYEAADLTQATLSEPASSDLDRLRNVSLKLRKLAEAHAPALSQEWRARIAAHHRLLLVEIARRTPSLQSLIELEESARSEITTFSHAAQPLRFAETALRIGILIRKRNWFDPNRSELKDAIDFLGSASPILEALGATNRAAECALERLLIRQQQLSFVREREAESDSDYVELSKEASGLVEKTNVDSLKSRLMVASLYHHMNKIPEFDNFNQEKIDSVFQLFNRTLEFLDNQEALSFAFSIANLLFGEGDRLGSVNLWRAAVQILDTAAGSRLTWTKDEELYLKSKTADQCFLAAQRIGRFSGEDSARPYSDHAHSLFDEIEQSFDWSYSTEFRYIDLLILENLRSDVDALRICANFRKFPQIQSTAKLNLTVLLNNRAVTQRSLEAAKEAFAHISELIGTEERSGAFAKYIAAFSAWQVARLTARSSPDRGALARRAHLMAQEALQGATDRDDKMLISLTHELVRLVEKDFPAFAPDLDAAALAAGN